MDSPQAVSKLSDVGILTFLALTAVAGSVWAGWQIWVRHRRATARLTAAALVAALRRKIDSDTPAPPGSGEAAPMMPSAGAAVRSVIESLNRQRLLPPEFSSDPGVFAPWLNSERLDAADAIFMLDAVEQILRVPRPFWPWSTAGGGLASPLPVGAKPDEAALLGSLTEKFYGSWAFRFVAGMLVVAAVFAIGGTALLGNQTINLRNELKEQGDAARKDLQELQSADHQMLESLGKEIRQQHDTAIKEIAEGLADTTAQHNNLLKQQADLEATIKSKRNDIDTYVESLKKDLHDTSVGTVVAKLSDQMESERASIRQQIVGPLEDTRNHDVAELRKSVAELRTNVGTLTQQTADATRILNAATPSINGFAASITLVNDAVRETGEARARVTGNDSAIAAALTNAVKAEADAGKAASLAGADQQAAAQARGMVQTASSDAASQVKALAAVDGQIKTLTTGVTNLNTQITNLRNDMQTMSANVEDARKAGLKAGAAASDLASLRERIDAMDKDLAAQRVAVDDAKGVTTDVLHSAEGLKGAQLRLATLEPSIDGISTRASAIATRLDQATVETGQLQGRVETLLNDLVKLEKRFADLHVPADQPGDGAAGPPPGVNGTPGSGESIDPPSKPTEIAAIQGVLVKLHLLKGTIDGLAGSQTQAAVMAYQRQIGEPSTGSLNRAQFNRLLQGP
jgi:predicted  nucleic acid-binding Zn-ribbon protein/F0F1-type ATP synthase membrane subunit b/b'